MPAWSSPGGRRSLVAVGIPALVVTLGVGGALVVAPQTDGALAAGSAVMVEFPLRGGQTGTWGTVLPTNPTAVPITIEAIEPIHPRGVEVVAIVVSEPDRDGGIGSLDVFPPPGVHTGAVEGATLSPVGSEAPHLQVLVGLRLTGGGEGIIEALRVRYRHDGTRYEAVLPSAVRITHATE